MDYVLTEQDMQRYIKWLEGENKKLKSDLEAAHQSISELVDVLANIPWIAKKAETALNKVPKQPLTR